MSGKHEDKPNAAKRSRAHFRRWAGLDNWSYSVFELWAACAAAVILVIMDQCGLFGGPQIGWEIAAFAILITAFTTCLAYFVFSRTE